MANDIDLSAYTPPSVKIDASISGGIADVLSVTLQINGLKNSSGADISSGVDFTKSKIYLGKILIPSGTCKKFLVLIRMVFTHLLMQSLLPMDTQI